MSNVRRVYASIVPRDPSEEWITEHPYVFLVALLPRVLSPAFQTVSTSYLRRVLVPEIKMLTILFPPCSISRFLYFKTFLEYLRVIQNT